jgi:hypothetical protein
VRGRFERKTTKRKKSRTIRGWIFFWPDRPRLVLSLRTTLPSKVFLVNHAMATPKKINIRRDQGKYTPPAVAGLTFEGFSGFGRAFVSSAPKVPMQTNSMDCGLFCLMNVSFIVEFCRSRNNAPLPFEALYQCYSQDDMPRIRQQVQLELARGKYTVLNQC